MTSEARRGADSYAAEISIDSPTASVFEALTTLDGIAGWWTSQVAGDPSAGGQLELRFAGLDELITMTVESTERPTRVVWHCERHTGHPEWVGTTIAFRIDDARPGTTRLAVHHAGLVPALRCYEQCFAGWQHFLRSIKGFTEQHRGMPFEQRQT